MPASLPKHSEDPLLLEFGAAIRATRLHRGISQEALADLAKIDRSYMGNIERGKQNVGLLLILRIAAALETTLADLAKKASL